ncbi:carotenoid isomerooxygenase-like [Danaus plexippus]|uniref:carotenoid isomerooxygenase-like n=1 Tax=Danaus plexippus TaxID=13037 RepID=UPI002AB07649|nr:carotenoid isomerooxygenase-like [Danaus plexippus]XP_032514964.2 carotenoid isomerooxygenase-like [Danaus plexippus]
MSDTERLYDYNMNIWLRNCEEEIQEPIRGEVTGKLPSWLQGTLVRNGPGRNKIGDCEYEHVFDGLALLHRFDISEGQVTYQCKFVKSETYKKNMAANRIVVTEFGTTAVPDPCRSIFDRISSTFRLNRDRTDNTAVSIYPFGDQIYAMTEVPVIYEIDPRNLETVGKKEIEKSLIVCHTAHPHVMPNGDVYNLGMSKTNGLKHVVVKFTYSDKGDMFESAEIVASMTPRWKLHPSYMHSFGITENYFVIIEHPLSLSLLGMARRVFITAPFSSVLHSYPDQDTQIVLINRITGEETRYTTDTIFYMHIINCFESDGKVIIDLCSYKDGKIIESMYTRAIKSMQSNPEYGEWCECRAKRLEIPLDAVDCKVEAKLIADVGCEAPRINYDVCNAKPYRYFYGIGSDIGKSDSGNLVKVDTKTGDYKIWLEEDTYPSEPIFVPRPEAVDEDDGVLLSALVWGRDDHAIALLVLDARDLKEIARVCFKTPSQATRCFHGWFLPGQQLK